jgi:succinate dehydrogenase / fumarate reductase flavoprotein subunit
LQAALLRDESRGAHFKPDFPTRNDERYLKATIAEFDPATRSPRIGLGPIDTSLVPPRARTYGKVAEEKAAPPATAAPAPVAAPVPVTAV